MKIKEKERRKTITEQNRSSKIAVYTLDIRLCNKCKYDVLWTLVFSKKTAVI